MNANLRDEALSYFASFSPGHEANLHAYFSPGRVNLIGEHLDYNGGYVFPTALTLGTLLLVAPRNDRLVRFASTTFSQVHEVSLDDLSYQKDHDYANYPIGILAAFQARGFELDGMDILFASDLPAGSGLSSSASIEVGTALAVNDIFHCELSMLEIVMMAQQVENQFIGVSCGIMDQFAVGMGKKDHAMLLDCETLAVSYHPLTDPDYVFVIANTNYPRKLSESKYNERREECDRSFAILRDHFPDARALAHIPMEAWPEVESLLKDATLIKRTRHVLFEQARTKASATYLQAGDYRAFGEAMNASHRSLQDDFEVTGYALDALAESASLVEGCLGSRMTGAGFGGCTVSLVHKQKVADFERLVAKRYQDLTGLSASFYLTSLGQGAKRVEL